MENCQIIELYWQKNADAISETYSKYGVYCFTIVDHILNNAAPPLFTNLDFLTNYRYDRNSIPAYRSAWFRPAVRRMKLKRPLKFLLFEDIYQKPYFLMGFADMQVGRYVFGLQTPVRR